MHVASNQCRYAPTFGNVAFEGSYYFVEKQSKLVWTIPLIDQNNSVCSLDFTVAAPLSAAALMPIEVSFQWTSMHSGLRIRTCFEPGGNGSFRQTSNSSGETQAFIIQG
jgi:hypothetical protein